MPNQLDAAPDRGEEKVTGRVDIRSFVGAAGGERSYCSVVAVRLLFVTQWFPPEPTRVPETIASSLRAITRTLGRALAILRGHNPIGSK